MFRFARRERGFAALHRKLITLAQLMLLALAVILPTEGCGQEASRIKLKTTSFTPGGLIPRQYTCDGSDISPALTWTNPPPATRSFALIEDDPDAPSGTFVHWVVYDLPADSRNFPEALTKSDQLPGGGHQGTNDFSRTGYNGPCPPQGRPHRYFIRLYALDVKLDLRPGASRAELDAAMRGHILAQGELMGRYER